jgi:[protein-PII] uridylyltransferase
LTDPAPPPAGKSGREPRARDAADIVPAGLSALTAPVPVTLADGGGPARERAARADGILAAVFTEALGRRAGEPVAAPPGAASGEPWDGMPGVALVAVGGYGRGELSPRSDLDLLVVTAGEEPAKERLQALLYPLWDAGLEVGHAVRSPAQSIEHAAADLETATALLSARLVAGDPDAFEALLAARGRWLESERRTLAQRILRAVAERHERAGRAGWALAPNLKEGIGGLRDLHAVNWMGAVAGGGSGPGPVLRAAAETLLALREALHAEVKRKTDEVRIDLQPSLARRLGLPGPDILMTEVHTAARTIEHRAGMELAAAAEQVLGGPRTSGRVIDLGNGIRLSDGELTLAAAALPANGDLVPALRLLAARSGGRHPVVAPLHDWLAVCFDRAPLDRWDERARSAFDDLLAGPESLAAFELLDYSGGWPVLLPEWTRVRGLAQYDPYHRFTVDGHLFATVAEVTSAVGAERPASAAAEAAGDLRTLYLAALLHDIGKGSGSDHSIEGARLARSAANRMGLAADDTDEVAGLVRHHLLLANTATRRDLDDPAVVRMVAETVGDARRLHLLYLLTIADARATGPEAWTEWKDALVRELYNKALRVLEPGPIVHGDAVAARAVEIAAHAPDLVSIATSLLGSFPPSYLRSASAADLAEELRLVLAARELSHGGGAKWRLDTDPRHGQPTLTVCVPDRPGTLARTAGVLALNQVSVLRAQAYATSDGLALERFVIDPGPHVDWARVTGDLDAAWTGRLAVEARLARKARDYRRGDYPAPEVRVLPDESAASTVVEVRAPDALGLLYAIAAALADLDLDLHVAKIDTRGQRVVDVFYVRAPGGAKLGDDQAAEVRLAIRHRVQRLLGG